MDELNLYDRDKGIFKQIVNKSIVMEGRYFVAPHYGHELNTNNLEQFLKDQNALADVKQKYPCVVCMPPKSRRFKDENLNEWEEYFFNLFFLTRSGYTGDNKIKQPDKATLTSSHHTWYDWKDMKEVSDSFLIALQQVIKKKTTSDGAKLSYKLRVDFDGAITTRLTKFNTDVVNGVSITFSAFINPAICVEPKDFELGWINDIVITDIIHPLHKH